MIEPEPCRADGLRGSAALDMLSAVAVAMLFLVPGCANMHLPRVLHDVAKIQTYPRNGYLPRVVRVPGVNDVRVREVHRHPVRLDHSARDWSAAAVAWLLRHPARIIPVLGTNSLARIASIGSAMDVVIDRQTWFALYTLALGHVVA